MTKKVGAESIRRILLTVNFFFVSAPLGFKELMMGRIILICPATTLASGVRKSLRWLMLNGREGI
jgi:hypothetical protein